MKKFPKSLLQDVFKDTGRLHKFASKLFELPNLAEHYQNIAGFALPIPCVCLLNPFPSDDSIALVTYPSCGEDVVLDQEEDLLLAKGGDQHQGKAANAFGGIFNSLPFPWQKRTGQNLQFRHILLSLS